jgi:chromosome partitioning protein
MAGNPQKRLARTTTIGNLKGGSGKTTNAVNLACMLAHGIGDQPPARVLFVDLEPLRTASRWLGAEAPDAERSSAVLFHAVPRNGDRPAHLERLRAAIQRAENEPVDIIPAHADGLEAADGIRGKEFDLKDNLALLAEDYDHVFLDLPGSRTGRLARSSLVASSGVLVPLQPGGNSIESTMDFFEMVEEIRRGANPLLSVDGIVISTAGSRGDVDAQIAAESLAEVLSYYRVFTSRIRTLKAIQRASSFRVSVKQMGDREAIRDYTALAEEWMEAIGQAGAAN